MSTKRFTPEKIESLNENEVFVFGSNIQGEHVGGAALAAVKSFGAEYGKGFGLQGNAYAIPTCIRLDDESGKRFTKPFSNVEQIKPYVEAFINDAKYLRENYVYYVTKIGCGIAGFKVSEIAELFRPCLDMDNVILPEEFVKWLIYPLVIANLKERGFVSGKDYDDDLIMIYVMPRLEIMSIDDALDEFEREDPI